MRLFLILSPIFVSLAAIFPLMIILGCNVTEPDHNLPNPIPDAKLITPQKDYMNEMEVQISPDGKRIYYIISRFGEPDDRGIAWQYVGDEERHPIMPISFNRYLGGLRLSPDETYLVYFDCLMKDFLIYRIDIESHEVKQLTHVDSMGPQLISPDGSWIAYWGDYFPNKTANVYIMTPAGDTDGPIYQVTHDQTGLDYLQTPPMVGYETSEPVCWLSNNELVVKTTRSTSGTSYARDVYIYNISDLSAPPQFLYTVDGLDSPLGYSENINTGQGWYLFSPYEDFESGHIFKAPIGQRNNYGEQLTFSGHFDMPGDIATDGTTMVFVRHYREGSEFLTGGYDVYLMNLN